MGNLEPFERKQTKWEGLWWHPETNSFSSGTISLADLKKFKGKVRIQIRKNKFFNGGGGRMEDRTICLRYGIRIRKHSKILKSFMMKKTSILHGYGKRNYAD